MTFLDMHQLIDIMITKDITERKPKNLKRGRLEMRLYLRYELEP